MVHLNRARSSSSGRAWISQVALVSLVTLAVVLSTSAVEARGRGRQNAAAAAAARKKQMIASLQKRLAVARQVLAAAENQQQMSQSEVNQAVAKLSEIRVSMDADEEDAAESAKSLHDIEDTILDKSSEFRIAQEALDTAKDDLHAILHKFIPQLDDDRDLSDEACRLSDMAKLSADSRKKLEENKNYQSAVELLKTQARAVGQLRQELLQADPQWVATRKEAADLAGKLRKERAQASATGIGSLDDRKTLRTAKSVAGEARLAIIQCEAVLRRLGAKPAAPPKKSSGG